MVEKISKINKPMIIAESIYFDKNIYRNININNFILFILSLLVVTSLAIAQTELIFFQSINLVRINIKLNDIMLTHTQTTQTTTPSKPKNTGNIKLVSSNGDINILASQDISNGGFKYKQDTISMLYDILVGTLTIPTYSHTSQTNNNSSLKNNNSTIISEIGNINIEAKNKDINIKGANVETKEKDINLLATNGNMNIESTQDKEYSNTNGTSYSVGGTMSYGESEDFSDVIKNNYTTIIAGSNKGSNGKVSVNTNNLNLVGINEETKDNLLNSETSTIKGNITEKILEEKNIHDSYAYSVSYNIPISTNTELGVGGAVNEALNDLISKTGNNVVATYFNTVSNNYQSNFNKTINPSQENINTQLPIDTGNWLGSLGNITVHYENDEGLNFTASPASVLAGGAVTFEVLQSLRQGLDELFKLTTGHDLNENKDLDKIIALKTENDVMEQGTYKDRSGNEKRYGYIDSGKTDANGNRILIIVNINSDGSLSKYNGALYRKDNGDHYGIPKEIGGENAIIIGFNTVGIANKPENPDMIGTPAVPKLDTLNGWFGEGSLLLDNPLMRLLNTDLVSKPHDTSANIFEKFGAYLFGKDTEMATLIQKLLTFPTALSVFLAPALTYGMPDGGYKYGSIWNAYINNFANSLYLENKIMNKLELNQGIDLNIDLKNDLNLNNDLSVKIN